MSHCAGFLTTNKNEKAPHPCGAFSIITIVLKILIKKLQIYEILLPQYYNTGENAKKHPCCANVFLRIST
jgi:hypothetical protein